jgi:hypothetical protein
VGNAILTFAHGHCSPRLQHHPFAHTFLPSEARDQR